MPELPEVETICRYLAPNITDKKITDLFIQRHDLRIPIPDDICDIVHNQNIIKVQRRAKYILLYLANSQVVIAHLGMSGKLLYNTGSVARIKHDHAIFTLNNENELVLNDPRRFGLLTICSQNDIAQHKLFKHLGVEPLTTEFNGEILFTILNKCKKNVKAVIMDANLIVGVGNIYAAESLFLSNILPTRLANMVTIEEAGKLYNAIILTLNQAIEAGGSTLKDYVSANGENGYFQHQFNVYGREKQPCIICNNVIKRVVQSGRSSFYCNNCQK